MEDVRECEEKATDDIAAVIASSFDVDERVDMLVLACCE